MSTGFPYGSFLRTSGDKYPGVPAKPEQVRCKFVHDNANDDNYYCCCYYYCAILLIYLGRELRKYRLIHAHQTMPAGPPAPQ